MAAITAQVLHHWGKYATADVARANAEAAEMASTEDIPTSLLVAMAYAESKFRPKSVSRLIDGKRVTGVWRSTKRPPGATGNFYCGVTQAKGGTWARCLALRDLETAYQATADELVYWLGRCARYESPWECALSGYVGGNAGAKRGTSAYARAALRRAAQLY